MQDCLHWLARIDTEGDPCDTLRDQVETAINDFPRELEEGGEVAE
jgi:hypothetical protein